LGSTSEDSVVVLGVLVDSSEVVGRVLVSVVSAGVVESVLDSVVTFGVVETVVLRGVEVSVTVESVVS